MRYRAAAALQAAARRLVAAAALWAAAAALRRGSRLGRMGSRRMSGLSIAGLGSPATSPLYRCALRAGPGQGRAGPGVAFNIYDI